MKKLKSLTIFFPFFNDAGTVQAAIDDAYRYGREVTNKLEVIAIHGGPSKDNTFEVVKTMKKKYPQLVVIDKTKNWERYAVIKYGFKKAKNEWIFYTDGDLQYSLKELVKLVKRQISSGADIVNGYRTQRYDPFLKVLGGAVYKWYTKKFFQLPIQDLECDFRLIRRSFVRKIRFGAHDSSILLELIKRLQEMRARFSEVKVTHYSRLYGSSNYFPWNLVKEKVPGDWKVWHSLKSKYN